MANEIQFSVSMSASKGGASISGSASKVLDMSGTEMTSIVQNFTTSESTVSLGGVDQAEVLLIKNMDGTNDLTIGLNNPITQTVAVIPPGAGILVTGISTTLYGKSSASTVDAFICVVET